MTWEEIKQRKEDSIRESTGNPMVKNPNPYEKNGKTYKSFSDYLNSDEYKEFLKIQITKRHLTVVENFLKFKKKLWSNIRKKLRNILNP